jgi:hypothetical protein
MPNLLNLTHTTGRDPPEEEHLSRRGLLVTTPLSSVRKPRQLAHNRIQGSLTRRSSVSGKARDRSSRCHCWCPVADRVAAPFRFALGRAGELAGPRSCGVGRGKRRHAAADSICRRAERDSKCRTPAADNKPGQAPHSKGLHNSIGRMSGRQEPYNQRLTAPLCPSNSSLA